MTPDLRCLLGAALLLSLAGCSTPPASDAPEGRLYMTGIMASVSHHATASGVLVEPAPGSGTACGIQAVADGQTHYFRRAASGALESLGIGTAGAVDVGDRVEVYVAGPVAESCPVQGRASAFVVLSQGGQRP